MIDRPRPRFPRRGGVVVFTALALLMMFVCAMAAPGCGEAPAASDGSAKTPTSYPYHITTTTGMITDITRQVAGDLARVEGIMHEGVDPHLYQPTRGDVARLDSADVVFYNGLHLEGKMTDIFERLEEAGKRTFRVSEDLGDTDEGYVLTTPGQHYDPHIWMDVSGWKAAIHVIDRKLSEYDPKNVTMYHANAQAYLAQLEKLDAYAHAAIQSIPEKQRVLITAHDAFNYMGRAYGIEVRGIQGISTESEAGIRDINNLIDFIVARNIQAVFVETTVADKNVRALVEGAHARGHEIRIGGSLFSDAMGKAGTYEGTYIGMIDHNVTIITRALGGEAPESGMQGKLTNVVH